MAAGVPVVISNAGALPELIDDNVEGRIIPVRDATALADALIAVAANAELKSAMGAAGRERALRDFDVSGMIDGYERLFATITGERADGPPPQ